ncbi:hypothetical protein BKA61DRAFT_719486, partial [Leptodontidium sp. MPI-SDFR-AT-0119]
DTTTVFLLAPLNSSRSQSQSRSTAAPHFFRTTITMATKSTPVDKAEVVRQDLEVDHSSDSKSNPNTALSLSAASPDQEPPPYNSIPTFLPSYCHQTTNPKTADNRALPANSNGEAVGPALPYAQPGSAAAVGQSIGAQLDRHGRILHCWVIAIAVAASVAGVLYFLQSTWFGILDRQTST